MAQKTGYLLRCLDKGHLLKEYYIHLTPTKGPFDKHGILLVNYGKEIGVQYNPVTVSQYGLANHILYLQTKDDKYKSIFLTQADWLIEHLVIPEGEEFGVWEYHFDYSQYRLKAPWVSAMAQGQGISVLTRAYVETDDKKYLKVARMALKSFRVSIDKGGVSYMDNKEFTWYEEYPSNPPPHVLNGFIFSLFGLHDFYEVTQNEEALKLFNEGVRTLRFNLDLYDNRSWALYDLGDFKARYQNGNGRVFRFTTEGNRHPKFQHPIDKITITTLTKGRSEKALTVLDVGTTSDICSNGSSGVYFSPGQQDWGENYILDGQSVRNYENKGGKWGHAAFKLLFEAGSSNHYVNIDYKDISRKVVNVEIFSGRYFCVGKIEGQNDGKWKEARFEIHGDLLSKWWAGGSYYSIQIKQLNILSQITGDTYFSEIANRFENYPK